MHTPTAPSLPLILQDEKDSWFKDSYWLFESSSKIYIIVLKTSLSLLNFVLIQPRKSYLKFKE